MTDFHTLSRYNHVLSPASRYLEFDIFIFWPIDEEHAKLVGGTVTLLLTSTLCSLFGVRPPQCAYLIIGINSRVNPGITAGQVMRWIDLLEPTLRVQGIDPKTIQLYPAVVTECNIVDCSVSKEGCPALNPADRLEPDTSYCCSTSECNTLNARRHDMLFSQSHSSACSSWTRWPVSDCLKHVVFQSSLKSDAENSDLELVSTYITWAPPVCGGISLTRLSWP
ncbi:hypothetical protein OF83DRAFT_920055 [Amylostereum chailletii]|nr:hypothetical protein OF83DRAFT_920055 [Amylostereum chailletii]